jgi:hypothetical protein
MLDVLLISIALVLSFLWLVSSEAKEARAVREEHKKKERTMIMSKEQQFIREEQQNGKFI